MAGIYIHIPFCFSRCGYCDFYTVTRLDKMDSFLEVLKKEINIKSEKFYHEIETIYFGGGTPSLIKAKIFNQLFIILREKYKISKEVEITIEVNPDDMQEGYAESLLESGFNRISIGIQSFIDDDLRQMGRRHNSIQAIKSIEKVQKAGFANVSIDLIYGLPWSSNDLFAENLTIFQSLDVQHLSAYHLTFESGTPFYEKLKKGIYHELSDTLSTTQYNMLCDAAASHGMDHYEISNFCKPGYVSRHNSSYWKGSPYIGFGPGSHSFYENKRVWNKPDLRIYITGDFDKIYEEELLEVTDLFNESIMLGLRTKWGVLLSDVNHNYPEFYPLLMDKARKWIDSGDLTIDDGKLKCTEKGWFLSDAITSELFVLK